jgi:hypothetical protein
MRSEIVIVNRLCIETSIGFEVIRARPSALGDQQHEVMVTRSDEHGDTPPASGCGTSSFELHGIVCGRH